MSRWFRYGIQGVAAGLAALLLTGTLHLLVPICTMPSRDATPPPVGCTMADVQAHSGTPVCTSLDTMPCCREEHLLPNAHQTISACSVVSLPLKANRFQNALRLSLTPGAFSTFTVTSPVPLHVQFAVLLI